MRELLNSEVNLVSGAGTVGVRDTIPHPQVGMTLSYNGKYWWVLGPFNKPYPGNVTQGTTNNKGNNKGSLSTTSLGKKR